MDISKEDAPVALVIDEVVKLMSTVTWWAGGERLGDEGRLTSQRADPPTIITGFVTLATIHQHLPISQQTGTISI